MNTVGRVKQGFYFDSVTLMRVGRELSGLPGVAEASVVMATAANQSILAMSDLLLPEFKKCGDQDLAIVVRAKDAKTANEALAKAVVDISGRPYCVCTGEPEGFEYCMIGGHFTGSLVRHVMESIAMHAGICLHLQVISGRDPHHIAEAEFKALARALRFAIESDPRVDGIPSTKGAL